MQAFLPLLGNHVVERGCSAGENVVEKIHHEFDASCSRHRKALRTNDVLDRRRRLCCIPPMQAKTLTSIPLCFALIGLQLVSASVAAEVTFMKVNPADAKKISDAQRFDRTEPYIAL